MLVALSIVASCLGVYAYGNNALQIFQGKMETSFWGRLIWLGTNSVVLLALISGGAGIGTIIPMVLNLVFMLLIQIACAVRRYFSITKIDVISLIIVAIGLICYLFANEVGGLLITLVADMIGGTLVILAMFRAQKENRQPENRRQYVLSIVRNLLMLCANGNAPTFLSVFGLAFQTFEAVILTIVAHITKTRRGQKQSVKN